MFSAVKKPIFAQYFSGNRRYVTFVTKAPPGRSLKRNLVEHILDNPIWNALTTGNKDFALGGKNAKKFIKEIAVFGGMKDQSDGDLAELYELAEPGAPLILFTVPKIVIPGSWRIIADSELFQMVYEHGQPANSDDQDIVPLGQADIPAMIDLTSRTNPGPFFSRTIEFGNYEGIFDGKRLVSMAGQRLQPTGFKEISAVCTDPDYLGLGYAGRLLRSQISKITAEGAIPFLHVLPANKGALGLYEKLGFRTRKVIRYYVVDKRES